MTNKLADKIWELAKAGFAGIWVQTYEPSEAIAELKALAEEKNILLGTWSLGESVQWNDTELPESQTSGSPMGPLIELNDLEARDTNRYKATFMVMENYHRFIESPEICQTMVRTINKGKTCFKSVIILSPIVKLPSELEKLFVVLDHELPTKDQLWSIATSLVAEKEDDYTEEQKQKILEAAIGLTRQEAESIFCLSLVRHGHLEPGEIWEAKAKWLEKSVGLSLYRSKQGFEAIGGLGNLKQFCSRALKNRPEVSEAKARGVLLLGPSGSGKSLFCKLLGYEVGRPVVVLDIGQLMGSLVGQTEANIKNALKTVDAMGTTILFVDKFCPLAA